MQKDKFWHSYPWQILSRWAGVKLECGLGLHFDAQTLRKECERILAEYHPLEQHGDDHAGGWKAIGLISPDGDPFEDHNLKDRPHLKTPALKLAPYLESIIDGLDCETKRVRMMQLLPGERILWHCDSTETIDSLNARVHIPIVTNAGVHFQISHEDCRWEPGRLWYGDFSFPHRLHNAGGEPRIHVVLDLVINDFVRNLFPPEILAQAPQRKAIRGACQRMVWLHTLPRYKLGYMKRDREAVTG